MKFLCIDCDEVMGFTERRLPGDGTLTAVFTCPSCEREMAMLTNPMETQLVSSLGVKIGGRDVPEQAMELTRSTLADGRDDAFMDAPAEAGSGVAGVGASHPSRPPRVTWTPEANERLAKVPTFVRGMVKRIYTDYAQERGIEAMTPEVMSQARVDLGLEGM